MQVPHLEHFYSKCINPSSLPLYRSTALTHTGFNNHPLPLVYSQLMAFCIYTYFFVAIFGRQFFLNKDDVPTSTPVYSPRPLSLSFHSSVYVCVQPSHMLQPAPHPTPLPHPTSLFPPIHQFMYVYSPLTCSLAFPPSF